jgi:hypothetical protein
MLEDARPVRSKLEQQINPPAFVAERRVELYRKGRA